MSLAERRGLSRREIARIGVGGFLHDLGKIGIPDSVLNKPGKLTDEEYAVIKTHPGIGAGLLADRIDEALLEELLWGRFSEAL